MDEELEKIDLLRERFAVSYEEAKKVLDEVKGDVVEALIRLENRRRRPALDRIGQEKVQGALNWLRDVIEKGRVTKIRLKKDNQTIVEIPASVGAVGVIAILASPLVAVLTGIGAVSALINRYTLEIERPGGETEERRFE
ncbi:MAG: DUF4342 domain-containing protein [Clostridia bacterium]|nr:DUF4342 domain-containing protein [Clostridia bacterium]